jgi:acyl-CoA thioester hydrolase
MADGRTPYELSIAVQAEDIDQLNHVNNVVYLRWVQEAAIAHWTAAASPEAQEALFWVVVRHEIDYKRPALPGDGIIARTWVGPAGPRVFERNTEILRASDRALLARARTLWCPMDRRTGRPTTVSAEVRSAFADGIADYLV